MKLLLKRIALRPTYTIGRLFIDGEMFCDTCEDKVRDTNKDGDLLDEGEGKVYAETAIPYGTYEVTLNVQSPRFRTKKAYEFCKGFLPRLLNVPHFEGILIHIGNTAKDSGGCILVGENKVVGGLINSTATFTRLYGRLKAAADRGEKIEIEIV
ncbi:MAG: hypothetical protein IJN51_01295 [Alistipes sp.]|nr:hypothetical protein [Alistipes sp.]